MTLVIITGGIDLSVGSLIALAAVTAAWVFAEVTPETGNGSETVPGYGLFLGGVAAIGVAGLLGLASGLFVTAFRLPPFIVTLGAMSIARGLAYKWAGGSEPVGFESELFHRLEAGPRYPWYSQSRDHRGRALQWCPSDHDPYDVGTFHLCDWRQSRSCHVCRECR